MIVFQVNESKIADLFRLSSVCSHKSIVSIQMDGSERGETPVETTHV